MIVMLAIGAVFAAPLVALFAWARRSERDIDYDALRDKTTQTDQQRRATQLGIGLTSGPTSYGR